MPAPKLISAKPIAPITGIFNGNVAISIADKSLNPVPNPFIMEVNAYEKLSDCALLILALAIA